MSNFIIVGTDTDAGKTTFAMHWLKLFGDGYAYWKPVETGASDTEKVRKACPNAEIFEPVMRLSEPVAPTLAARREGREIPSAAAIASQIPQTDRSLLIETFGGPLSPLNERELQIQILHELKLPCLLVSQSTVGAITRALTTLRYLQSEGVEVFAVVLIGPRDEYAVNQIRQFGFTHVHHLTPSPAFLAAEDLMQKGAPGMPPGGEWRDEAVSAMFQVIGADLLDIDSTLDRFYVERTKLDQLVKRDEQSVWHPYTPLRGADDPLPVVAAQNEFLELADGRRLIDGISSWWTILHGHREPRLMTALHRAAERIDHVMFAGVTHSYAVELAEMLLRTVPWQCGRVFFSDNGSTAVEVALKMAYQFWRHRGEPQRRLFVGFENSYHGDTFGAMAVGRDPLFFGQFEPLLFRTERVPVDASRLDECLTQHPSEVAAVIIEPLVQGAGGMRFHSQKTLCDITAVCSRHNVLLIADEVMTAGRTGTWWAHSQAGIAPDIICSAKTLAGGVLSLAATLISPRVVAEFDVPDREKTFFHGHSFTAHPLACAVAVENLRMLSGPEWVANAKRIEEFWGMAAIELKQLPGVANVRVRGTILACDIGDGGYLAAVAKTLRHSAIANGVLLRPLGNVLYAMPPLRTSEESLGRIVDAMKVGIRSVTAT